MILYVHHFRLDKSIAILTQLCEWFNGDGNVSAFRISGGKCHFKQRYVQTEKFVREREAQRALLGKIRLCYRLQQ